MRRMTGVKKNKLLVYVIFTIVGAAGVLIGRFVPAAGEAAKYFIGIGAALLCCGLGRAADFALAEGVQTDGSARRMNIELNDEQNIRIREKVGAATNRAVLYVLSLFALVLGFTGADVRFLIMIVFVILLELLLAIVLTNYYSKQL